MCLARPSLARTGRRPRHEPYPCQGLRIERPTAKRRQAAALHKPQCGAAALECGALAPLSGINGPRQRREPERLGFDSLGQRQLRISDCGVRIEKQRITGRRASVERQRREPFDLKGLASLWVVLGCEFAPLTRGRLWVSPELPRSPANHVVRPRNSPRPTHASEKHGYRPGFAAFAVAACGRAGSPDG